MSADPSYWLDHFNGDVALAALVVGGLTRRRCPWCERELRPCNMARHIDAAHFHQMTVDEILQATMPEVDVGSMNAMGWVLVAAAQSETPDALWDLLEEFAVRRGTGGPGVHSLKDGMPRYCVHPTSEEGLEFRDDDLHQALLLAATWVASQMPEGELWRRD